MSNSKLNGFAVILNQLVLPFYSFGENHIVIPRSHGRWKTIKEVTDECDTTIHTLFVSPAHFYSGSLITSLLFFLFFVTLLRRPSSKN